MVSDPLSIKQEGAFLSFAYIMCYSTIYTHTFKEGYAFTAGFPLGLALLPFEGNDC